MRNLIEKTAEEKGIEIECYKSGVNNIEQLHTDNCKFIDFGLCEGEIKDWGVVEPEDYNKTLYSNCGEIQDDSVIVVIIE